MEAGTSCSIPSPACGRRWPDEVGSDEGSLRMGARTTNDSNAIVCPHPTPLRGATFSHKWEKGRAFCKDFGGVIA